FSQCKLFALQLLLLPLIAADANAQVRNPLPTRVDNPLHIKIDSAEIGVLSVNDEHKLELSVAKYVRAEIIHGARIITFDQNHTSWFGQTKRGRSKEHGRELTDSLEAAVVDADTIFTC